MTATSPGCATRVRLLKTIRAVRLHKPSVSAEGRRDTQESPLCQLADQAEGEGGGKGRVPERERVDQWAYVDLYEVTMVGGVQTGGGIKH